MKWAGRKEKIVGTSPTAKKATYKASPSIANMPEAEGERVMGLPFSREKKAKPMRKRKKEAKGIVDRRRKRRPILRKKRRR